MSVSTHGLRLKTGSHALRVAVELLSSMRFAISLLTVICIASIIGTVLKQHEPVANYVNQFGPFWAELFRAAQLDSVYSAWWFLLILAFLVVSTSLCIARNTPHIVARPRRPTRKTSASRACRPSATAPRHGWPKRRTPRPTASARLLAGGGWKVKLQHRDGAGRLDGGGARPAAPHKLGYIAAHSAIVLVCLGGLLDGDLIVRAQIWWGGKSALHRRRHDRRRAGRSTACRRDQPDLPRQHPGAPRAAQSPASRS